MWTYVPSIFLINQRVRSISLIKKKKKKTQYNICSVHFASTSGRKIKVHRERRLEER